jgi:two-component system nitrogen regulation response regulator GlnG
VREGGFRAPLLHRLAAHELRMPPLRERRDDLGRLLVAFLEQELAAAGEARRITDRTPDGLPWLSASLVARLADLECPGNVRQLRNAARQLVLDARGQDRVQVGPAVERLLEESAPAPPRPRAVSPVSAGGTHVDPPPGPPPGRRKPSEVTTEELTAALRAVRWDLAAAASRLSISRASLYLLIEKSGTLRTAGDLSVEEIEAAHRECGGDLAGMVERLSVSENALRRRLRELGLDAPRPGGRPPR